MQLLWEDIIKLLLAFAVGGVIGFEREMRDKAAGFRTLMFICVGSTLFTIFSVRLVQNFGGSPEGDPSRIAAQIVTGIGFLGAGVILREHGEIRGLTTASTIWLAAALGVGVGAGEFLFTVLAALIILFALLVFPHLEGVIGQRSQTRQYRIKAPASQEKYADIVSLAEANKLRLLSVRRNRSENTMDLMMTISGSPASHETFVDLLFHDPEIQQIEN